MAMKLRIVMYDDDTTDHGPNLGVRADEVGIELDPRLEARIVQEEVWAQTSWPKGEGPVAEVIPDARMLERGERMITLDSREWEAVRRAIVYAGDCIEAGGPSVRARGMLDDQPTLAAVLERMGGRSPTPEEDFTEGL